MPIAEGVDSYQLYESDHYSRVSLVKMRIDRSVSKNRKKDYPLREVRFMTSQFPLALQISRPFVQRLLIGLSDTNDVFLLSNVRYLIRELWDRTRYLVSIYAFFHWLTTFLVFTFILFLNNEIILLGVTLFCIFILTAYEFIVFIGSPSNYI